MKNVCDILPETLDGQDLYTNGYHRRCYQEFTTHLDRLQIASANASTSKKHHSPCKKISTGASFVTFPTDECIFCEKNEIKVNRKTQRPTQSFVAFKRKESGGKKIDSMAETLGKSSLCHRIKGIDLYAANAHYHDVCYHPFYCNYNNHMQRVNEKTEPNTEKGHKTAAHSVAYTSVKELLKTEVIGNSSLYLILGTCDLLLSSYNSYTYERGW